jgi:hypothetical protein
MEVEFGSVTKKKGRQQMGASQKKEKGRQLSTFRGRENGPPLAISWVRH